MRRKLLLSFALAAVTVFGIVSSASGASVSNAKASGYSGGAPGKTADEEARNPTPSQAAAIVGIEQLVAAYGQYVDWGPDGMALSGQQYRNPELVGNLFTPKGNFDVLYWNNGVIEPLSWHPESGPGYDQCSNIGPEAIANFFGGAGPIAQSVSFHHVITNVQVHLDRGSQTATVRATLAGPMVGLPNESGEGGNVVWTNSGRYLGKVRLTRQGWKFDYWAPILDIPGPNQGCFVNN